jgi:hypothetical protein
MLDPAWWWEKERCPAIAESYIAAWAVDSGKVVSLSSLTIKISMVSSLLEPIFFSIMTFQDIDELRLDKPTTIFLKAASNMNVYSNQHDICSPHRVSLSMVCYGK